MCRYDLWSYFKRHQEKQQLIVPSPSLFFIFSSVHLALSFWTHCTLWQLWHFKFSVENLHMATAPPSSSKQGTFTLSENIKKCCALPAGLHRHKADQAETWGKTFTHLRNPNILLKNSGLNYLLRGSVLYSWIKEIPLLCVQNMWLSIFLFYSILKSCFTDKSNS